MNVEITGACGGIGSVLVDRLIHSGHNMVLIDNLLGGSEENIEKNEILSTLKLIDIHDFEKVYASLIDWEVIFHLTAISSLAECQSQPTNAFKTNFLSTQNIANIAVLTDGKVIFASTSAVYKGNSEERLKESLLPKPHLV